MKGKFSLNRLLNNNKLMLIFSLIAAIAIWASVVYGIANTATRIINDVPVILDLSKSYAGAAGLKIIESDIQQVSVKVTGPRFAISKLDKSDILVTGNFSEITSAGTTRVKLIYLKNSNNTNYELVSMDPQEATVTVDHIMTVSMKLEADVTGVTAAPSTGGQLGTPVIEAPELKDNMVHIEGPKAVVSQIASVVAKVKKPTEISTVTTFESDLVALDADGNVVDTKNCKFQEFAKNTVNVTVPVLVHRKVDFKYTLKNVPEAFKNNSNFCTISPSSIDLVGTPDQVEYYAKSIENLGTFDFDHLDINDAVKKIPLNVPQGVQVLDGTKEVTVNFDMAKFTYVTLDLALNETNTRVINVAQGKNATVSKQTIFGVKVIGRKESIDRIKESDLSVVVDMKDNESVGAVYHKVKINVGSYSDVWVYYGSAETSGYDIYVTIQ